MKEDKKNELEHPPPIYFIRHNFNESLPVVKELEKDLLIAIHFDKAFYQNITDYQNPSAAFKSAFNYFRMLGKHGDNMG